MKKKYDVTFIGHLCFDQVCHYDGSMSLNAGGAAVYGAVAAARIGKNVSICMMYASTDENWLDFLKSEGIDIFPIFSQYSTYVQVIHESENMDNRRIITKYYAGRFRESMIPAINSSFVHLAGCNDHEFSFEFIQVMKSHGYSLSVDMQCFIRYNDPVSGEINFRDDPQKEKVVSVMDRIKLDITEARILLGTQDMEKASSIVRSWGCPEVMITSSDGIHVRYFDQTYFASFTNGSTSGRTGRGDTAFGAYLARRVDHDPQESVEFAAALVSIKMEKPGPFSGTLQDVLDRIAKTSA